MLKYLVFFIITFSSCRTVQKVFHKDKEHIDSTANVKVDSVIQKHIDTTKITEVKKTEENTIEIDLSDPHWKYAYEHQRVDSLNGYDTLNDGNPVKVFYINPKDYFVLIDPKTGKISSSQPITKVIVKGRGELQWSNFTGGVDSSLIEVSKSDNTVLKKDILKVDKTVNRKVSFTTILYWGIGILLLFVLIYLIYRYRKNIKAIILKLTTGL